MGWLLDLLADLAVIATLFVLWRGLWSWQDSLRGGDEYEVRRDAEVALLLYRERMGEFRAVRSLPDEAPPLPELPPKTPVRLLEAEVVDLVTARFDLVVAAKDELLRSLVLVEVVCDLRMDTLLRELADLEAEAGSIVRCLRTIAAYLPRVRVGSMVLPPFAIDLAWHNLESRWHVLRPNAARTDVFSSRFDAAVSSIRKGLRTRSYGTGR